MNSKATVGLLVLGFVLSSATYPSIGATATFCVNEQADDGTGNANDCTDGACTGSAGTCSLRDALLKTDTNADTDDIVFSPTLTSPLSIVVGNSLGLPTTRFPVNIKGPGADVLTITSTDGCNNVFWFDAEEQDRSYSVSGLTLTHTGTTGFFPDKIIQHRGKLTLSDSVISGRGRGISGFGEEIVIERSRIIDNFTAPGDDVSGAGINFGGGVTGGILRITDSVFSGNKKLNTSGTPDPDEGGGAIGVFDGGSLLEDSAPITVELTNVTISGNETNENGGGLWISDNCAECNQGNGVIKVKLTNVTLAENKADLNNTGTQGGGGLFMSLGNASASVTLNNVLMAKNTSGGVRPDCSVAGILLSNGHNLVGDDTGCAGLVASDLKDVDPLLAALVLNPPGKTETHALQPNSPAINKGDPVTCPPLDQRGVARQGVCDIGAYELVSCGDGVVGPGEACDGGVCCSAACQFEAAGTACDDGNANTSNDQCSASGLCQGTAGGGGGGGGGGEGGGCGLTSTATSQPSFLWTFLSFVGLSLLRKRNRF